MKSGRPEPQHAPVLTPDRSRADALCVLLLLLVTLAVYAPALFRGRVLLPADIVPLMRPWAATAPERFPGFRFAQNQMLGPIFEYYSWRHYARERLRQGEVPLWNPYELCGNVLLANSQSAVLYPPNLLLSLFPLWTGINLVTALHTFLTGLFMFGLLRALRLRPVAALTGALAWMFCGVQIVWTEFQTPTAALCWLPGALWAWTRYARGDGWTWGVFGAGGAMAMSLLAGHLHFAFYVVLAFVLYGVVGALGGGALITRSPGHPVTSSPFLPILVLAGALVFAATLSAATLLPVVEMGRMNFRAVKPSYESAIALRLPPANLLTLAQPDLFGNPRDYIAFAADGAPMPGHSYWGKFDYIEYTAYPGIPVLILAVFGIGYWVLGIGSGSQHPAPNTRHPAPSLLPFLLMGLLGLLLALGTPLCALFFYGVPGYKQFNATARALCLLDFALPALAACGVQALIEARERGESRRIGSLAVWSTLAIVAAILAAFPGSGPFWKMRDPAGREVARLLTDQWMPYALAGMARGLAFALLTGLALWLVLRSRKSQVASRKSQDASRKTQAKAHRTQNSELGTHDSRHTTHDSRLNTHDSRFLLLPLLALADLLVWSAGFNPVTDPQMLGYPTETTTALAQAAPDRVVSLESPQSGIKSFIVPNYNAVVHLREAQGADSLHTRRYHRMMEQVVRALAPERQPAFPDPNTLHVPGIDHPLFDLLNVRYATTEANRPMDARRFRRVQEAELTIWENPRTLGRAWIVGQAERAQGVEPAFARLSAPGFDPRRTALLEKEPPPLDESAAGSPAAMTRFSPHHLIVETDSRGRGLMVLSETYYPGWQARVDGLPAPILTADYLLRAVPVPAGRHRVTLDYEPTSYRLGLYLSALALGILAAIWACRSVRQKPI